MARGRRLGTTHTYRQRASSAAPLPPSERPSLCKTALLDGLASGFPGAIAMVAQVVLLMWVHTVINYQLMEQCTFIEAFARLYSEGGVGRFYQGIWIALILAPLARFGDTAANAAALALSKKAVDRAGCCGTARATLLGSAIATAWRMVIYPVDTLKKTLQVHGSTGWSVIAARVAERGLSDLYAGGYGSLLFTAVSHYAWFCAFNVVSRLCPKRAEGGSGSERGSGRGCCRTRVRHGFTGLAASLVATVVSNGLRVVKTTKQLQSGGSAAGYGETVRALLEQGGVTGLLLAGMGGRLLNNVLSGLVFSIVWKGIEERVAELRYVVENPETYCRADNVLVRILLTILNDLTRSPSHIWSISHRAQGRQRYSMVRFQDDGDVELEERV